MIGGEVSTTLPEPSANKSIERIAPQFAAGSAAPAGVAGSGRTTTLVIEVAEVVRKTAIESLEGEGLTLHRLEVRYHSVHGDGEGFARLSLSTRVSTVADDMIDLFDVIAGTLEFAA